MNQLEIEKQLISKTAGELPGLLRSVWSSVSDLMKRYDFAKCVNRYKKAIAEDYGYMQILGMEKPVPLDNIYTEVKIATRVSSRNIKSPEELLAEARIQVEERSFKKTKEQVERYILGDLRKDEIKSKINLRESEFEDETERLGSLINQLTKQYDQTYNKQISAGRDLNIEIRTHKKSLKTVKKKFKEDIHKIREEIIQRKLSPQEQPIFEARINIEVEQVLEKLIRKQYQKNVGKVFYQDSKRTGIQDNAWESVMTRNRVMILGKPGAGKTTFLNHILLKSLYNDTNHQRLPIFIPLRNVDTTKFDLFSLIVDEFDTCDFPNANQFVDRIIKKSNTCILLLDGLDEVPAGESRNLIREIFKFSRKYRKLQIVVSCRTASYRIPLNGFTELEIVDFGPEQVLNFVKGWFHPDEDITLRFINEIRKQPNLSELTTTPLLLAILCIAYKRNQSFPDQKTTLYHMCIDALFVDWDSTRDIRRENYVAQFDVETKKQLLAKIACDSFCDDQLFIDYDTLLEKLRNMAYFFGIEPESADGIIHEYTKNHGLLVERAKNIFSFSHLTIHEFFVALYLKGHCRNDIIKNLFEELWSNAKWKEVITFLGGLVPNADNLIVIFVQSAKIKLNGKLNTSLLLSFDTPECCSEVLSNPKIAGDHDVWIAWFRAHILYYFLSVASANIPSGIAEIPNSENLYSNLIRIGKIKRGNTHELRHDKPINSALGESISSFSNDFIEIASNLNVYQKAVRYFRIIEVISEIIANRPRLSPEIKRWALSELFQEDIKKPPCIFESKLNRLGL